MVLLTSSQVSIAITSFIIFLFTSALFSAGYVLQQKTVNDLRAAIRPKEVPQQARLYLPKKFQVENIPAAPSPKENGIVVEVAQSVEEPINMEQKEQLVLEVVPDVIEQDEDVGQMTQVQEDILHDEEEKPLSTAERRRRIKAEIMEGSEEAGFKGYRRRMW